MLENLRLSFQGIWNHKMRSFLTMLGIIIGIAAIITIVSTIKGTNEQIKQNLIGSGTNAVVIKLYQNDMPVDVEYSKPDGIPIMKDEMRDELQKLDGIEVASLFRSREWANNVYYQNTAYNGSIKGIDDRYFDVYGYQVLYGRAFTESDFTSGRKLVMLDTKAANAIFNGKNPVGETIEFAAQPFTVIGVVATKNEFKPVIENLSDYWTYADSGSGTIYMTHSAWPIVYGFDEPQTIVIKATDTNSMTAAGKAAADYIKSEQITDPNSTYTYRSEDMLQQAQQLQEISNSTNRQLIWIACISLLVGGIGVMNIMLVTVTERTNEIGLKKAIGAKKRNILLQFLTEAAVLTSLGGILGVGAGIGFAQMWSTATATPTAISLPAILIAVGFSMLIGILFGLLPAVKAASLNPIEALRRD